MTGIIKLFSSSDEMFNCRYYSNKKERKNIIVHLLRIHKNQKGLYFHFEPKANIRNVRANGMNYGASDKID